MTLEPRQREAYSDRQIEAAHRVLIDVGQPESAMVKRPLHEPQE